MKKKQNSECKQCGEKAYKEATNHVLLVDKLVSYSTTSDVAWLLLKGCFLPSSIAEAGCRGWDHSHGISLHLLAPPFWIIFCFGSYFAHYTIFQCGMPDACQC